MWQYRFSHLPPKKKKINNRLKGKQYTSSVVLLLHMQFDHALGILVLLKFFFIYSFSFNVFLCRMTVLHFCYSPLLLWFPPPPQVITSVAINPSGDWIALGVSSLGQLVVWEWQSETYVLKQQVNSCLIYCIYFLIMIHLLNRNSLKRNCD